MKFFILSLMLFSTIVRASNIATTVNNETSLHCQITRTHDRINYLSLSFLRLENQIQRMIQIFNTKGNIILSDELCIKKLKKLKSERTSISNFLLGAQKDLLYLTNAYNDINSHRKIPYLPDETLLPKQTFGHSPDITLITANSPVSSGKFTHVSAGLQKWKQTNNETLRKQAVQDSITSIEFSPPGCITVKVTTPLKSVNSSITPTNEATSGASESYANPKSPTEDSLFSSSLPPFTLEDSANRPQPTSPQSTCQEQKKYVLSPCGQTLF
jgi:hypothetical protein